MSTNHKESHPMYFEEEGDEPWPLYRSHKSWGSSEEEELVDRINSKQPLDYISRQMGRSIKAIKDRLSSEYLDMYHDYIHMHRTDLTEDDPVEDEVEFERITFDIDFSEPINTKSWSRVYLGEEERLYVRVFVIFYVLIELSKLVLYWVV